MKKEDLKNKRPTGLYGHLRIRDFTLNSCPIEKKRIHIHYNDLYEIYNFGTPFLGHHCYTLSLLDLCLGVEKKIVKETMQFHYMTYMATL